jgi:tetratricopeptide (TPR) repeat protein
MSELDIFKQECSSRLKLGSYEDVAQLCRKRLLLHPDDAEAILFLAEARLRSGDSEEALGDLEKLNARLKFLSKAFALLGEAYTGKGQHELAKEFYGKFLANDPDSDLAVKVRFKMEAETEDRQVDEDIRPAFKTATMVELMIKQGYVDTAREILKELLNDDPSNLEIREKLAAINIDVKSGPIPRNGQIIGELERWQDNLARLKKK